MIGLALAAVGLGGSLALGGLFFVLVHHATQAGWSVVVRRLGEQAMSALPFLALLFIPLILSRGDLFEWSHPEAVARDPLLAHKEPYFRLWFFLARNLFYFGTWSALSLWFGSRSRRQDETGDHELTRRMRRASAPSLILYALTVTFFSFDWLMSLNPHWYSTIFGLYFYSGCVMSFFAFLALATIAAKRAGLLVEVLSEEHQHDIGKLLFTFVTFWAYMAFSQYLLIWYANLPEETVFFAQRFTGSWRFTSVALALGHFIVPFFFLLPRTLKRNASALAAASVWLLLMQILDLYWLVMPNLHPAGVALSLIDPLVIFGCCGLFLAAFGSALKRQALVPLRDPRLPESLTFENV